MARRINAEALALVKRWSIVGADDECWPFRMKNKVRNGTGRLEYGQVTVSGRKWRAHRYVAHAMFGDLSGMHVCHRCDNPLCLNPAHLFLGTNADNVADKMAKGRHRSPRSLENGAAKVSDSEVLAIRKRAKSGEGQRRIAADFGISRSLVSMIKNGRVRPWLAA